MLVVRRMDMTKKLNSEAESSSWIACDDDNITTAENQVGYRLSSLAAIPVSHTNHPYNNHITIVEPPTPPLDVKGGEEYI